jgi:hypothetical protein
MSARLSGLTIGLNSAGGVIREPSPGKPYGKLARHLSLTE